MTFSPRTYRWLAFACLASLLGYAGGILRQQALVHHILEAVGGDHIPATAELQRVRAEQTMLGCILILKFHDRPERIQAWLGASPMLTQGHRTNLGRGEDLYDVGHDDAGGSVRVAVRLGYVQITTAPGDDCPYTLGM